MKKGGLFLVPIAAAAFVATWGGWVGLGEMTGFGEQNLLPGFVADDKWSTVNLVITLPLMVESYAAYAMNVWFSKASSRRARAFAGASSVLSLLLAATGQISFHVLESERIRIAPTWLTGLVAVLPVLVLGMAAALHLLSRDEAETSQETTLGRLWGAAAKAAERRIDRLGETPPASQVAGTETKPETSQETPTVSALPSQPETETTTTAVSESVSTGQARDTRAWDALPRDERVAQVGAMRLETPRPSYAKIAERLDISKAEAARLGQAAEERLEPDPFIVPDFIDTDTVRPINGNVPDLEAVK
jgi:hypothetical protein